MHKFLMWILLFTGIVAGMTNLSSQTNEFSLEQRLPAQTLLLASFPNISQMNDAMSKTGLAHLLQEPEVRDFVESCLTPYQAQIQGSLLQAEMILGIPLTRLAGILHGEVALALVDFDPSNRQMPFGLIFSMELGPNRQTMEEIVAMVQKRLGMQFQSVEQGGKTLFLVPGLPISFTWFENALIVASKPELIEKICAATSPLLRETPSFQKAKKKVQRDYVPGSFFYLNLSQVYAQFGTFIQPAPKQLLTNLGVFDIASISLGFNIHESVMHNAFFVEIQGDRRGITRLFHNEPCNIQQFAKEVPKEAVAFMLSRNNLPGVFEEAEQLLRSVDAEGKWYPMYQQFMEQLEQQLGFSIQKDLIASFGSDGYSFQFMPPDGGLLPYTVGVQSLRDAGLFNKWSTAIAKHLKLEIKKTTYQNQEIQYLVSTLGKLGSNPFKELERARNPLDAIMASLSYGFSGMAFFVADNRLYTGQSMYDLKSFLDQRGQWQGSILDNPDFQKMAQLTPATSSVFIYQDWRVMASGWWNTLVPILRSFEGYIRGAGIPFETAMLPQAKTMSRHFVPLTLSYTGDEDGLWFQAYSTTGGILLVPAVGGIVAAVAIPEILRYKIEANEKAAIATLRQLHAAQKMFQASTQLDQNGNGTGEYGYLQELTGTVLLRGQNKAAGSNFMPTSFLEDVQEGIVVYNGYCYLCYLPGAERAMDESEGMNLGNNPEMADAQEQRFVIYAWPLENQKTGRRAFALSPNGDIYECWAHSYSLEGRPNPEDAYSRESANAPNLDGSFAQYEGFNGYWYLSH